MPSSSKNMSGTVSATTIYQVGSVGMEDQLLKLPCSKWGPSRVRNKAVPGAKGAPSQNKKKTRKQQRFMACRSLEEKGVLGSRLDEEPLLLTSHPSTTYRKQGSLLQGTSLLPKEDEGKAYKKWGLPCLSALDPSVGTTGQLLSSQGHTSWATSPTSSEVVTSSLSCLMPKKPRKCVAIDCEMVGTGPAGKMSELARCTVVNYDGDVIYDKYVRPEFPIVDYRTRWSGITRRHMENATSFRVVRSEVLQILKDKIVVGHAIHNDFRALKYFHPQNWTRDTSQSPVLKEKGGLPLKGSVSLKNLAWKLLHKKIQVSKNGHSSAEDAQASMELYRLVEVWWEQDVLRRFPSEPENSLLDSSTDSEHYMEDQYWPEDLDADCK